MDENDKKVEDLINNIIDNFLDREEKEKEPFSFYPSEIPYCQRKNYYSRKAPIPFDKKTKRIFHTGNLYHNFITYLLKHNFEDTKLLDSERSVTIIAEPEYDVDIRGRLDNLVLINLDNEKGEKEKTIFEVKSSSSIQFLKEPQKHHVMQLTPYLRALQLKKGYIVYVEKNTLQTKVFPVKYDKEIFLNVVKRARDLAKHLRENTLPEAEGKVLKDWQCKYCPKGYKEMCDKEYNPTASVI